MVLVFIAIGNCATAQSAFLADFAQSGSLVMTPDTYNQSIDLEEAADGDLLLLSASGNFVSFFDLDITVTKINRKGELDASFATNGVLKVDFEGMDFSSGIDLEVMDDGSMIILGSAYSFVNSFYIPACLMKVQANGQVDASFGNNGTYVLDFLGQKEFPSSLEIDHNGKILVSGSSLDSAAGNVNAMVISRLEASGIIDTTFAETGRMVVDPDSGVFPIRHVAGGNIFDLVELDNGKIMVAGDISNGNYMEGFFLRINSNGGIDSTFLDTGWVAFEIDSGWSTQVRRILLLPDGNIAFGANVLTNDQHDFVLGHLNSETGVWTTERVDFSGQEDYLEDMVVLEDGGVVAVGRSILVENVSAVYKSDLFSTVWYPDFNDWTEKYTFQESADPNYESGAQAVLVLGGRQLFEAGFVRTDVTLDINLALMGFDLNKLLPDSNIVSSEPLLIFPNPSAGTINVGLNTSRTGVHNLYLFDLQGKLVGYEPNAQSGPLPWSGTTLAPGTYIMVLDVEGETLSRQKVTLYR